MHLEASGGDVKEIIAELEQDQESPSDDDHDPPAADTADQPAKPRGHGRKRLPPSLTRERIEHELSEAERQCPHCAKTMERIGEVVSADTLLDRLKSLNEETAAILREARTKGSQDNDLALQAISRVEKQLEFEARLLGQLSDSTRIAVGVNVGVMSDLEQRRAELQAGRERARRARMTLTETVRTVTLGGWLPRP